MRLDGAIGDVIAGAPGTRWRNGSATVKFQLKVVFIRSCAYCIARANLIADAWTCPFHINCLCMQTPILPGAAAPRPFLDVAARVARMSGKRRAKVMGISLYKLVESGRVSVADVAGTAGRVKGLREVVEEYAISDRAMRKAGIPASVVRATRADLSAAAADQLSRATSGRRGTPGAEAEFRRALGRLRGRISFQG